MARRTEFVYRDGRHEIVKLRKKNQQGVCLLLTNFIAAKGT